MSDVPARQPSLLAFELPEHAAGFFSWPYTQVTTVEYHRGDEVDVTLDRPLLTNEGFTTTLRFVAGNDYDTPILGHYIPSFHLFDLVGADAVATTADRGAYHVTSVTLTQASSGLQTTYTADQLAAQGFSTGLFVAGSANPLFVNWRNSDGSVSNWYSSTASGSIQFQSSLHFAAQHVDPAWTAIDTMSFAGTSGAILWQKADGRLSVWYGDDPTGNGPIFYNHDPVGAEWRVAATGDANADGQGEILWQRSDGAISTWSSTGQAVTYTYDGTANHFVPGGSFVENSYYHASVGANWLVEGMADFSGDSRSDILWRNTDGSLCTWNATDMGPGIGFQDYTWAHAPVALSWHVVGLADFNGDGKDDILWRNDNGAISVWTSTGNGFVENQMNAAAATSWQVAEVGDVNGDARADILWRNSDGAISMWTSTGSGWNQNVYYDASVGTDWTLIAHHFVL